MKWFGMMMKNFQNQIQIRKPKEECKQCKRNERKEYNGELDEKYAYSNWSEK